MFFFFILKSSVRIIHQLSNFTARLANDKESGCCRTHKQAVKKQYIVQWKQISLNKKKQHLWDESNTGHRHLTDSKAIWQQAVRGVCKCHYILAANLFNDKYPQMNMGIQ